MLDVARFKQARADAGLTQRGLAKAAGVSDGTIKKIELGNTAYPRRIIDIAAAMNVNPKWLLGESDERSSTRKTLQELVPIDLTPVKLKGIVEAGVWREAIELMEEDQRTYLFRRRPNFEGFERMALEIHGESMNKYYPPGTVLDTVKLAFAPRDIEILDGDHVVVQRVRSGLYETTVKELRGGDLWPCSTDPRFQDPIRIGETEEEIQIVALVLEASRQRPNLENR